VLRASIIMEINKLSQKEIKSLINIVYNHYADEQFENENSYASSLINKLEGLNK
jgi:hypothetical protein